MATKPKSEPGDEYLTPEQRAKKYGEGNFTASQTGARAEAARHFQNQMKESGLQVSSNEAGFEELIQGKRKLP